VAFRREARMVRGRALVAAFLAGDRGRLDEAAAVAGQLERDRTGATRAMGALLAACVTAARGDATSAFARAAAALDAEGMAMLAAAARWRLGELQGGADGQTRIADARAAMVAEGVRRPERLLAVLAPAP
jgi:eukaryotic-like serine/threonine-protein kinase